MRKEVSVTTIDNPFNQFDDFYSWYDFDMEKGYNTSSKLARLTNLADYMTTKEIDEEIERAVDRLIEIDPFNIYIKVYNENSTNKISPNPGEGV